MNCYLDDFFCTKIMRKDSSTTYFCTIPSIDTMVKLMAAYANSEGGCIIWGVDDDPDFQVIGLGNALLINERILEIHSRLPNTLHCCFNKIDYRGQQLIGIIIFKSQKTVFVDGIKYIANANKSEREFTKLFISHSSEDAQYGCALAELMENIGVFSNNIIFTSKDRFGIPVNGKTFDYLKNEIHENTHMIYLLSNHYFDSPASLNEMGASWMVGNEFTFIGVPTFNFGNPKFTGIALDNSNIGFTMENKDRMIEFRDLIYQKFNLPRIDERRWNNLWDNYLEKLQ